VTVLPKTSRIARPIGSVIVSRLDGLAEGGHGERVLVGVGDANVPLVAALGEGHALALDGGGDDGCRTPVGGARLCKCVEDAFHVVAIDLDDPPAERRPLGPQLSGRLGWQPVLGGVSLPAVLLQPVVIDDGHQVVEAVARGHEGGFPDRALLALPISEQGVGSIGVALRPGTEGDAHRRRDAQSQRPGGHVKARQTGHVGVPLQSTSM
jgi:hypothetical protein